MALYFKRPFIPCLGLLLLMGIFFVSKGASNEDSTNVRTEPPIEWNINKLHFPLQRKLALTHLNKPINISAARQLPNGLVEIYSRNAILLFDGKRVFASSIPFRPGLHPRLSAAYGKYNFYINRNDSLSNDDPDNFVNVKIPIDTNARFTGILTSASHVIMSASDGNLILYNIKQSSFQHVRLPVANEIFSILKDRRDQIWVATDGGIFIYKIIGNKLTLIKNLNQTNAIPDNITTSIDYDGFETIVAGSYESGLYFINTERFEVRICDIKIKNRVDHIRILNSRYIVLSVEGIGVVLADMMNYTHTVLLRNTVGRDIKSIFLLDEGWISIFMKEGDVMMVNPVISSVDPEISGLQCVRQIKNEIYLGTSHGLYKYSSVGKPDLVKGTSGLNIVSLYEDQTHGIWIGTYGQGLYNLNQGALTNIDQKYKMDKNIMSMDGFRNKIYLATLSGAYSLTLDNGKIPAILNVQSYQQNKHMGARFIYSVNVDTLGNPWFGSDGKGLWTLNGDTLTPYMESLYGNRSVQSVYHKGPDLLVNLDGSEFNQISLKGRDTILLKYGTTNISGFTSVDHNWSAMYSENIILLSNTQLKSTLLFNDLFEDKSFIPTLNSSCELKDGSALICTDNEIIKLANTDFIKRTKPLTVLHSVTSVASGSKGLNNHFDYNENTIEINFSGIWYNYPEKISYRYRLKNYEEKFKTTLDNHIFYTNLPPGTYDFEIETVSEQLDSIPNITSFQFSIAKPYYATWWFRILGLSALVGSVYFAVKAMESNRQRKQKMESEKLEAQISILKSQINPHFLFNSFNTLTALIEENPTNAHLYIDKLSSFYRVLLTMSEDAHTIGDELKVLMDFYFLLKQRFGDNLELEIDVQDESGMIPTLTFQLLFENVINHNVISKTRPMKVTIFQNADGSIIFSNIKQRKTIKTPGTGIGLENIKNRFRLMFGKELIIEDGNERFEIILPFAKDVRN